MAGQEKTSSVPACFFFVDAIDRSVTGYQVCRACELVAGEGNIVGAQKLYGLWRVYPATAKARNNLIVRGVTIGRVFVPILNVSPVVAKGSQDSPTTKLIIGNIPLSVANTEIEKELKKIEGVSLRSKIYEENYRDDAGKLTLFKSGRRFVYIDIPPFPLPQEFLVGHWKPSLYHFGQKQKQTDNSPSSVVSSERQKQGTADSRPPVTVPNTASVSALTTVTTEHSVTKSNRGEFDAPPDHTDKRTNKQTSIDMFCYQAHRSRPSVRSPRESKSLSPSGGRTRVNKRQVTGDHARSPSLKSQRRGEPAATSEGEFVDYFDLTPNNSSQCDDNSSQGE